MATIYQRNMNKIDPSKIENIFDTVNECFIPIDEKNLDYQKVLKYCSDLGITIYDLDPFPG